jgi:hypothetical protein
MLTLDADRYVSVNDQGGLVIQSYWEKQYISTYGRAQYEILLAVIEDNVFSDDDGEHIDWPAVEVVYAG